MLINWLTGADQHADRYLSSGKWALINLLTGACQDADSCLSLSCVGAFQLTEWAVVKLLTGTDQVVDQALNDKQSWK